MSAKTLTIASEMRDAHVRNRIPLVAVGTRSDSFDIQAKYFLNQNGINYCLYNHIPLRDLHGWDGERGTGFAWRSCRADSLKHLVVRNMLSHIELDRSEFISARAPLIGMTRLFLAGALIARFRPELKRLLVSNPHAARLLAAPSALAIFASRDSIASAIGSQVVRISSLRDAVATECIRSATGGACFDDAEEGLGWIAELIDAIDKETLLLLTLLGPAGIDRAAETVLTYAKRVGLAGQLSLLLMELIQVAEKSYYQSLAQHDRSARAHPEEIQHLLSEPEFRERLIKIAAQRGESMVLRISFAGLPGARSGSGHLDIAVRTKGLIGYGPQGQDAFGHRKSVKRTDLECLLKSVARDDQYAELSLAYYAGFEKACAQEGMAFSSSVVLDEMKNETVTTMSIAL